MAVMIDRGCKMGGQKQNPVLNPALDIKERLRAHLFHLEYLQQEEDKLERINESYGLKSPSLDGMPKGSGGEQCIMLNRVVMALEISDTIKQKVAELAVERKELTKIIEEGITSPLRRKVIYNRYIMGDSWDYIIQDIYGDAGDFNSVIAYHRYSDLTHAIHSKALSDMRRYLNKERLQKIS